MKRKQHNDNLDADEPMASAASPVTSVDKRVGFVDSRVIVRRPKKPDRELVAATAIHDMGGSIEDNSARYKEYRKEVEVTDALKETGFWSALPHDYVAALAEIEKTVNTTSTIEPPYAPDKSVAYLIKTMERGIEDAKSLVEHESENRKIYAALQKEGEEKSEDFPDPKVILKKPDCRKRGGDEAAAARSKQYRSFKTTHSIKKSSSL